MADILFVMKYPLNGQETLIPKFQGQMAAMERLGHRADIVDLALESLDYADLCLINAPFTREVRDVEYMRALPRRLQKKDARLVVVWVKTDPEVVHQRMIQRNSDRDIWKLQHWDAYNAGVNYEIPECLNDPTVTDEFYVVSNNSDEELRASMRMLETMLRR